MIRQSCSPIPADVCAEESEPTRCTLTRAVESISDVTEECLVVEALECQEDMQATTCTLTPGQGCEVAAGSGTCTYVAPQAAVASVGGSCAVASGSGSCEYVGADTNWDFSLGVSLATAVLVVVILGGIALHRRGPTPSKPEPEPKPEPEAGVVVAVAVDRSPNATKTPVLGAKRRAHLPCDTRKIDLNNWSLFLADIGRSWSSRQQPSS